MHGEREDKTQRPFFVTLIVPPSPSGQVENTIEGYCQTRRRNRRPVVLAAAELLAISHQLLVNVTSHTLKALLPQLQLFPPFSPYPLRRISSAPPVSCTLSPVQRGTLPYPPLLPTCNVSPFAPSHHRVGARGSQTHSSRLNS